MAHAKWEKKFTRREDCFPISSFAQRRREMAYPVLTKTFLHKTQTWPCCLQPFRCTNPPLPVPHFLLMQNLQGHCWKWGQKLKVSQCRNVWATVWGLLVTQVGWSHHFFWDSYIQVSLGSTLLITCILFVEILGDTLETSKWTLLTSTREASHLQSF